MKTASFEIPLKGNIGGVSLRGKAITVINIAGFLQSWTMMVGVPRRALDFLINNWSVSTAPGSPVYHPPPGAKVPLQFSKLPSHLNLNPVTAVDIASVKCENDILQQSYIIHCLSLAFDHHLGKAPKIFFPPVTPTAPVEFSDDEEEQLSIIQVTPKLEEEFDNFKKIQYGIVSAAPNKRTNPR